MAARPVSPARRPACPQPPGVTLAAVLALAAAQLAGLPLPLWSVLTAVIVTQMSVGRSLKTARDYLVGTLGGALYGGAVAVLIPHQSELALIGVLVLAIAPLALIAAIRPNLNVVPITAIIVLLVPTFTHSSPLDSAINRVLEVALGAVVGLLVSFFVLPAGAHSQAREIVARMLDQMAEGFGVLVTGICAGLEVDVLYRVQDRIGETLIELNTIGTEAERERSARLSSEADTGPLRRTVLRIRHDLVMLGRAVGTPMPVSMRARLKPLHDAIALTASQYMKASGAALLARSGPPSMASFERALAAYEAEVDAMRKEGITSTLPGDAAERFFAVGFSFEQMHQNFRDLERVVAEWSTTAKAA